MMWKGWFSNKKIPLKEKFVSKNIVRFLIIHYPVK